MANKDIDKQEMVKHLTYAIRSCKEFKQLKTVAHFVDDIIETEQDEAHFQNELKEAYCKISSILN